MKKHLSNLLTLAPITLFAVVSLSGCGGSNDNSPSDKVTLKVLNSADYIYEQNEADAYDSEASYTQKYLYDADGNPKVNMMDQFVQYMAEKYNIEVSYVYDTFDTNETMYNELMTGKSSYDIIVTSDYMIQKLISSDMIQPITDGSYTESDELKSIRSNISPYLSNIFDTIHPKNYDTNEQIANKVISQYSVPYMWGTVGVMYNPSYYADSMSADETIDLFKSWEALYSEKTKNTFSIKDSVRDMYGVSIVHAFYESDIKPLEEKYESGELSADEFNAAMTKIFNRCDNDSINQIKYDLMKLKANSFGFEVDSGKTDMVEGKIGANIAWSGDAAWAISEAEGNYGTELYFSIPKEGSNIWFDGFCVPKDSVNKDLAVKFIDFMSQPTQAIQNMWNVGYTSAVAGDDMLSYVYENYDIRGEVGGSVLDSYADVTPTTYDLSYFFGDSIADPASAVLEAIPSTVGRTLSAQYPENSDLPHLCVMDDFGKQNEAVLDMWEHVRSNALPAWGVIILVVEILLLLFVVVYFLTKKIIKNNYKKERRKERLGN